MKIGDLVRQKEQWFRGGPRRFEGVGIIIEVYRRKARELDYRTPTSVLVFYGTSKLDVGQLKQSIWFLKSELELVRRKL